MHVAVYSWPDKDKGKLTWDDQVVVHVYGVDTGVVGGGVEAVDQALSIPSPHSSFLFALYKIVDQDISDLFRRNLPSAIFPNFY